MVGPALRSIMAPIGLKAVVGESKKPDFMFLFRLRGGSGEAGMIVDAERGGWLKDGTLMMMRRRRMKAVLL